MVEQYLIIAGSIILISLGFIHLVYTFFTNKFMTRNPETMDLMKKDFPILTKQTTVWKAWIGFNASHSIGAQFFGAINIIIAINHIELFKESLSILVLNDLTLFFYVYLAKKYWFAIPFRGIVLATFCFLLATICFLVN